MASKRQRSDAETEELREGEELKRQKSYNQILSLLEEQEEQEEEIEDLSSIITTLQQEISSPIIQTQTTQTGLTHSLSLQDSSSSSSSSSSFSSSSSVANSPKCIVNKEELEEEGEREKVMRHLLEASDDELGIPNGEFFVGDNGVDGVALCDALWELEDEAANYYTLFQSQLFM